MRTTARAGGGFPAGFAFVPGSTGEAGPGADGTSPSREASPASPALKGPGGAPVRRQLALAWPCGADDATSPRERGPDLPTKHARPRRLRPGLPQPARASLAAAPPHRAPGTGDALARCDPAPFTRGTQPPGGQAPRRGMPRRRRHPACWNEGDPPTASTRARWATSAPRRMPFRDLQHRRRLAPLVLGAVDHPEHAPDELFRMPAPDDVGDGQPLLHVGGQDVVEHVVGGQRVLVHLPGLQLRGRRLREGPLRDGFPPERAVGGAGDPVDQRLRQVADHRQPTRHVAVEGAVPDGELALVPGGEEQRAGLVGDRHEDLAADAGLDVLLGEVAGGVTEGLRERGQVGGVHRLDEHLAKGDAQPLGQDARVLAGVIGAVPGRHADAGHASGAERRRRHRRGERAVDAAREADHRAREPALADVVAHPEDERPEDLVGLPVGGGVGRRRHGQVAPVVREHPDGRLRRGRRRPGPPRRAGRGPGPARRGPPASTRRRRPASRSRPPGSRRPPASRGSAPPPRACAPAARPSPARRATPRR